MIDILRWIGLVSVFLFFGFVISLSVEVALNFWRGGWRR
jgi:hypothetical protein